jgi:hypothetical protein
VQKLEQVLERLSSWVIATATRQAKYGPWTQSRVEWNLQEAYACLPRKQREGTP